MVERSGGIVYTTEFIRIESHYKQESNKIRQAPLWKQYKTGLQNHETPTEHAEQSSEGLK